jgi:hypothetical protein
MLHRISLYHGEVLDESVFYFCFQSETTQIRLFETGILRFAQTNGNFYKQMTQNGVCPEKS